MKKFFYRNRLNLLLIFLFGALIYLIRVCFYTISIDTECLINNPDSLLDSWSSIGRFGLVGIKNALHLLPINIVLTNLGTFIIFYLSIVVWLVNIERWQKKENKIANLVFGLSLISSPIFVEQFGFTLQSFEIAIAFLFVAIGIYFQGKWLETNKIWYILIAIILLEISITCYQAFILLYITICVFDYFIKYNNKMNYKLILKYIVVFSILLLIYFFIDLYLVHALNIEKSSYLQSQMYWGKESFIKTIARTIYANIVTTVPFLGIEFDITIISIFMITSIYLLKKYKIKDNKMFYIVYLFLFITPFITGIIKGDTELFRAKFSLAFLISFILFYLMSVVETEKLKNIIKYLVIYIILIQTVTSVVLFVNDYIRYREDVNLGQSINEIIQKMDTSKPVVFVGQYKLKNVLVKSETLGCSFFEWDSNTEYGINLRANGFLKTIGILYEIPSLEQIEKAKVEAEKMEVWPNEKSIEEKEEYIIVNFGQN